MLVFEVCVHDNLLKSLTSVPIVGTAGATLSLGGDPCPGTPKKLTLDVECAHKPSGPTSVPWHLTAVRVVAQVRPVNYTGSFNSSDPVLTQSWSVQPSCPRPLQVCSSWTRNLLRKTSLHVGPFEFPRHLASDLRMTVN